MPYLVGLTCYAPHSVCCVFHHASTLSRLWLLLLLLLFLLLLLLLFFSFFFFFFSCKSSCVSGKALQSAATLQRNPFWQPHFADNRSAALQPNLIGHIETLSQFLILKKDTLSILESFLVIPKVSPCH